MNGTNPYLPPFVNHYASPVINPVVPQLQMPSPQMQVQTVSGGEESAKAFSMGPNSSVILLDANDPLIWFVSTDASGYKTVKPFTITPYVPEEPVSPSDLKDQLSQINNRLDMLEERMNTNGKSNYGSAWKGKSVHAIAKNVTGSQGSSSSNPTDGAE